jgi:hypothetical protein
MWAARGSARTIADVYASEGCHILPAPKGPGSRVTGWQRIHSYLSEAPACPVHRQQGWTTCPRLHLFSTLEHTWAELSGLPHSTAGDPEDADPKAPDHLCDSLRYALASLGTEPEFVIFNDDETPAGTENAFGIEVLAAAGVYGVRRGRVDDLFGGEDREKAGQTKRSPFV